MLMLSKGFEHELHTGRLHHGMSNGVHLQYMDIKDGDCTQTTDEA